MEINDIINLLETSSIISKDDVSLVILGGSRGCGCDDEGSDYDLNFYLRNQPKKWECCMNTYGFVKIGKQTVHWYSHPRDLTLVNTPPEFFYYAKLPLEKEDGFFPCDEVGQEYMDFLERNSDDISLYFLKKLFTISESNNSDVAKNFINSPLFSPKWYYGFMLLANYFGLSNYSREEIFECKNKKIPPIKTKNGLDGIRKLKKMAINSFSGSSPLFEEDKKWKQ